MLRPSNFPKDGTGGAGEKHVRDTYPREMKSLRSNSILIAVIDADDHTVEAHDAQLNAAAERAGVKRRSLDSPVIHVIPKWSIETWLCYLENRDQVDETKSMKNQFRDNKKIPACAEQLVKCYRATEGRDAGDCQDNAPESLKKARPELERFFKAYRLAKPR
ncbi:MAG: hypothetical protein JXR76_17875 [Deltaproteobacteria bacterium]|nr:hypothetical protein [Deltaproteobacteria bacterium]